MAWWRDGRGQAVESDDDMAAPEGWQPLTAAEGEALYAEQCADAAAAFDGAYRAAMATRPRLSALRRDELVDRLARLLDADRSEVTALLDDG